MPQIFLTQLQLAIIMIAAVLRFYDMRNMDDRPKDLTLTSAATLPKTKKLAVLSASLSQLLEKHVATYSQALPPRTTTTTVKEGESLVPFRT